MAIQVMSPDYRIARERMVKEQVIDRGITNARVIDAMLGVPRHRFLDSEIGSLAYSSHSFPIGHSQTMSQAYMVAFLADNLELRGEERVLEIGTGSGYQAAVLAMLSRRVFTIERIPELAKKASRMFAALGLDSIEAKVGDGALGWPEGAPFDRILLTAAAVEVPQALLTQLRDGGFLLGPVAKGPDDQEVVRLRRQGSKFELERLTACSFVPLVREPADADGARPVDTPNIS